MRERRRKGKKNCNDESNEKKRIARRMEIYIYRTSHAERERERNTSTAAICVPDCYLLT